MGVYIKGVTIPKDCWHCAYEGLFPPCGTGAQADYKKTRHPDCPLVEVKDPHGRLIDADKEYKELSEMKVEGEMFTTAVEFSKRIVQKAPTVIEAEGEK